MRVHCGSSHPWPLAQSWLVIIDPPPAPSHPSPSEGTVASSITSSRADFRLPMIGVALLDPVLRGKRARRLRWLPGFFRASVHPKQLQPQLGVSLQPSTYLREARVTVCVSRFCSLNKRFYSESTWPACYTGSNH